MGVYSRYIEVLSNLLTVSNYFVDYPFANRLYPKSLDVVEHVKKWGPAALLTGGDVVFQPRKVQRSGLFEAVDGNVLIYVHKEENHGHVGQVYPADHYILVDDKLRILNVAKKVRGVRVNTVFVGQGHYAVDRQVLAAYPPADVAIERIDHLLNVEAQTLLGACKAGH